MQKNSWRSLDSGGNGYLNVYEGGAPSSHRIREGRYIYLSQIYINRPEEAPEEGGRRKGSDVEIAWRCETGIPLPPPQKGTNGRRPSLAQRTLLSLPLSLNLNITASQMQFLSSTRRHIGRIICEIVTSQDTLYIWMMLKVKVSEEQSIRCTEKKMC